jgi:peptidoglycan hydrolase CwlO-like protein
MRLILMACILALSLTSTGQITLASNTLVDKLDVKRAEKTAIAQPENNSIEAIKNELKKLEKKNDDLAKENEELKKSIFSLQANIRIQLNLQPPKTSPRDNVIENVVFDY